MTTEQTQRFLVFVSHTSKDTDLALRIALVLDSLALPAFVYEKYQIGGQNRFEVIKNRITECPYFLLLLTRRARQSEWVNQEIGFAVAMAKEIIPLVETSPIQRRRISYFGFTELNDPLNVSPNQPQNGIGELLHTMMSYAMRDQRWSGMIRLSCECGWTGREPVRQLTRWYWICRACRRNISVSPVTFEPLPQEP